MQVSYVAVALTFATFINVGSASHHDNNTQINSVRKLNYTENGQPKTVTLYWGSDPARAAASLIAGVLRNRLGYQNVRLQYGPHSLQDLAAQVTFDPRQKYKEVILAISAAWTPVRAPQWEPNRGKVIGMAGPRLQEFGASPVPARQQLYVHLPHHFRQLPECANYSRWKFYTNITILTQCGFIDTSLSHNETLSAVVYGLDWSNTKKKDLEVRAKASLMLLRFDELHRKSLFLKLRAGNHSFLFVDYDIWSNHENVIAIQMPPCVPDGDSTCQQDLDTAIAFRVGDVSRLEQFAPALFQFAYDFKPSIETLRILLELESNGRDIEEAAYEWVSKNGAIVDKWLQKYDSWRKIYELTLFLCSDDPDSQTYSTLIKLLGYEAHMKMNMAILIQKYNVDCSDIYYVKNEINIYMPVASKQRLLGIVLGSLKNITEVVKSIDGVDFPIMLYDGAGIDVDSTKSVWLSTGRSLHLALALRHFILSMKWTRVAVLSEQSLLAKQFIDDLNALGGFRLGNYSLDIPLVAEKALKKLKLDNGRIIVVNTNYKDAVTILTTAVKLKMTEAEGFVWIVREWEPNKLTANIKHFTISFWCRSNDYVGSADGWPYLRDTMAYDILHRKSRWPAKVTALADAVLTVVNGYRSLFLKYPDARDDLHSGKVMRQYGSSLVEKPFRGVTQNLTYREHSLEDTAIFVEEWYGNQSEFLARWRVNTTDRTVRVEHVQRDAYHQGLPPHDGSSGCLVYSGDPYLPTCYDYILAIVLSLLWLILVLVTGYLWKRNRYKKTLTRKQEAWRQELVAPLPYTYLMKHSALKQHHVLRAGQFSCVRLALLHGPDYTPRFVAAKALYGKRKEDKALREASVLASLNHNHIIRLVGVCIDKEPPLVLMEIAFFGDLLHYLQSRRYLAEGISASGLKDERDQGYKEAVHVSAEALTRLAREATSALVYLSLQGMIHRNLRASNCLVDANRSLKLADFSLVCGTTTMDHGQAEDDVCQQVGQSILWMAPESMVHGLFSTASDIWALGILIFELVTLGERPYGDMSLSDVKELVVTGGTPPMPRDATSQTNELVRMCWQRKAEQRRSAEQIMAYMTNQPRALHPALNCHRGKRADADSGLSLGYSQAEMEREALFSLEAVCR